MRSLIHIKLWAVAVLLCCAFTCFVACGERPVAYDFCSTSVEGWEPGDTLKFHVDTLDASGVYNLSIGVRTSSSTPSPYQTLWMVVRQQWHHPDQVMLDTIKMQLTNEFGDPQGHGVTLYQFDLPWRMQHLQAGQWADISIYHIMRREMLPGISNVGIRLQPQ